MGYGIKGRVRGLGLRHLRPVCIGPRLRWRQQFVCAGAGGGGGGSGSGSGRNGRFHAAKGQKLQGGFCTDGT